MSVFLFWHLSNFLDFSLLQKNNGLFYLFLLLYLNLFQQLPQLISPIILRNHFFLILFLYFSLQLLKQLGQKLSMLFFRKGLNLLNLVVLKMPPANLYLLLINYVDFLKDINELSFNVQFRQLPLYFFIFVLLFEH